MQDRVITKPVPKGELEAELGRRFRLARERAEVRLTDVASHLGCSINTVRWHEAGTRLLRVDDVVRFARLIGCDPSDLVKEPIEDAEAEGEPR